MYSYSYIDLFTKFHSDDMCERFLYKEKSIEYLDKYNWKYYINHENRIVISRSVSQKIKNHFFNIFEIGDIVYIPKNIDIWNTNEKRFIIKEKYENYDFYSNVLILENFKFNNIDINPIWFGYFQLDKKTLRKKKLKRILYED
jgi:hypothetical protein